MKSPDGLVGRATKRCNRPRSFHSFFLVVSARIHSAACRPRRAGARGDVNLEETNAESERRAHGARLGTTRRPRRHRQQSWAVLLISRWATAPRTLRKREIRVATTRLQYASRRRRAPGRIDSRAETQDRHELDGDGQGRHHIVDGPQQGRLGRILGLDGSTSPQRVDLPLLRLGVRIVTRVAYVAILGEGLLGSLASQVVFSLRMHCTARSTRHRRVACDESPSNV